MPSGIIKVPRIQSAALLKEHEAAALFERAGDQAEARLGFFILFLFWLFPLAYGILIWRMKTVRIPFYYKKEIETQQLTTYEVFYKWLLQTCIFPAPFGHSPCDEGYHYPHFIDRETEPQRDYMMWGKVCKMRSWGAGRSRLQP